MVCSELGPLKLAVPSTVSEQGGLAKVTGKREASLLSREAQEEKLVMQDKCSFSFLFTGDSSPPEQVSLK